MTISSSLSYFSCFYAFAYCFSEEEDDEEEGADEVDGGKQLAKKSAFSGECPLDYRTQLMVMIIFSEDMFSKQMSDMNLGKVHPKFVR